ncbi:MAG: rhomboid family intramembrane serine protease [Chloroflexi bacterium]|nr:rhomboid family intramembrane serine protease [Chloroflexota bacterium]
MDHPRRPDETDVPSIPPTDDLTPPSDTIADAPPAPARERAPGEAPVPAPELGIEGPLSREAATAVLDRAAELMSTGDYRDAAIHFRRVVGFGDHAVTAAALLGLGQALYRLDEDEGAVATWESVLELPDTPSTYRAWREVAAARVRSGDLNGAIAAYRQADRRAPAADKPEIANRLGWLAKETGNSGASRRYFARSRGSGPAVPLPRLILGLTVAVSFLAFSADGSFLFDLLALDKVAVADGEYWRLWTVTLLHGGLPHLFFNMYALYLSGPIVEVMYGSRLFLLFYLVCAAAGSVASFVFGAGNLAVGASGAIFGLIGVLLSASRTHHPVLDRQSRSFVGQLGTLILINLAFGFAIPQIDNAAHIGGLVAGLWLGFLIVPGRVSTLRSLWQGGAGQARTMVLPTLGVAALLVVIAAGVVVGTEQRRAGSIGVPAGPAAGADPGPARMTSDQGMPAATS